MQVGGLLDDSRVSGTTARGEGVTRVKNFGQSQEREECNPIIYKQRVDLLTIRNENVRRRAWLAALQGPSSDPPLVR